MRQFVQTDDHDTKCGGGTGTVQQASASYICTHTHGHDPRLDGAREVVR